MNRVENENKCFNEEQCEKIEEKENGIQVKQNESN